MKLRILILIVLPLLTFGQSITEKAKALYESKKYDELLKLLESIEDDSKEYAIAQYYLGRTAFDQKKYDDAADYFEEATETNDKVADYFSWLGDSYGMIARDANPLKQGLLAPKMKSAWERAIELDPKNLDARISLIQYYLQAPGFMGGSIEKAKEVAQQVLKLRPAEGHRQLGNIYLTEEKVVDAENEFILMTKADPVYMGGLVNFYINQKKYDKAFQLFDVELKKKPDDFIVIYQFGKISALSGKRLEEGEVYLRKYLTYTPKKNEPNHAATNMRLAQILEKKGNKIEAKKLYNVALKMDPNLNEAKEGLQRVSK